MVDNQRSKTKIALTGGIATGKSYVLARLREHGLATIDADEIVHEALASRTAIAEAIGREFGASVVQPDGSIDRAGLAKRVFTDPDARLQLERIVHPFVYDRIQQWFDVSPGRLGIASIPLLYETGRDGDFDFVIVTACSLEQQLERLTKRGMPVEEARLRITAQLPTAKKTARAGSVIWTGGSEQETRAQVEQLLERLRAQGLGTGD
jgi:dephospho-CoA kinase